MLYLGKKPDGLFKSKYTVEENPETLEAWPKPIVLDKRIDSRTLEELLETLNGEGTFFIEECNEVKVSEGIGINDHSFYRTIFGEIEKSLEHEGPYFSGPNGETKGYFSFYKLVPKTNIGIVLQLTTTQWYSKIEDRVRENKTGHVYFLRKAPVLT